MKTHKHFNKNEQYYWQKGKGRIERGTYQKRFFNKEVQDWAYCFKGLEIGLYYTVYLNLGSAELKFWQLGGTE